MSKKIFELAGVIAVDGMTMAVKGLKELDSHFKAAEKSFFKFGRQLSTAGAKLSTNLTLPLAAAAGAATMAAKAFGDYGDKLLDMRDLTGLSTDTIQELKQAASDAGTSFEGVVESVAKLTMRMPELQKGTGPASEAMRALGINVFDSNGSFRDINVLFPEIIKKLQNVKSETDRTAIAQEIFGKGVKDLSPVLGMTNDQFDASMKKARDLGLVMSEEALNAANDFRIGLADATNQLVQMGREVTLELLPVFKDTLFPFFQNSLIPMLRDMGQKVADVARWFNGLDEGLKKAILGSIAFVAAAGPVVLIVGKMIGAIAGVTKAIKIMRLAMVGFTAFMGTNPLGLALIGIGLLTAAIIGVVSALDKIKKKKAELAADKTYSASAEEERKDNLENIRLWEERLAWLKAQHNPTQTMIDEMADLKQAIVDTNEALGNAPESGGVGLFDPEAEARKQKAIDAEKKRQDEIERIHKESLDRIARATLDANELNLREEEAAVRYATNVLKMKEHEIHAIRTGFRLDREKNDADAAKKREDYLAREEEAALNREKEWTAKLVEQSGNRISILENERAEAIAAANGKESEIAKIEKYYREEKRKAEKEMAREAHESFAERVRGFIDMIGNIGAGIAGIFQQSTANRQIALDNQQQAERSAIENSTRSEKEKRKALADLDKKQDSQQRAFRKKAAAESKKIGIFESIMGTASAIISALGAAPWSVLNFAYAGVVGAIGAAKTALIAAQPLPLAAGGLVQSGRGGVLGHIGEGRESEIVLPMDTGVKLLAKRLLSTMRDFVPAPLAAAGAGGYGGGGGSVAYNIGTFIGDDRGIKEFERRQLSIRNHEAQRKGQMA